MDLDEVRLKEASELSEDEGKFLKENEKDLTDAEKDVYKDVLEEKEEDEEEDEDKKAEDEKKFNTAVEERVKELQTEAEEKKNTETEESKEKRVFPKGYKPEDWDDFAKTFLGVVRKDREIYSKQQRERMSEIDRRLDAETEDLRKIDSSIPESGSKERREFDRSLAEIMIKDPKITNITRA